jgi:hypothetical protein
MANDQETDLDRQIASAAEAAAAQFGLVPAQVAGEIRAFIGSSGADSAGVCWNGSKIEVSLGFTKGPSLRPAPPPLPRAGRIRGTQHARARARGEGCKGGCVTFRRSPPAG